jgi:uracil-DNA glycosylase family protein
MVARKTAGDATPFIPPQASLSALARAARDCKGCPLYAPATQTVFGEGPAHAPVMLVGEQPGDVEDREGRPFVGPAGKLLDRALDEAGIARKRVYVTNAVKHFKFVPRGKRRMHSKPSTLEVRACLPWLAAEVAVVKPRIVVCLGATAAQALLGSSFRVTTMRGQVLSAPLAGAVLATVHPSAILRMRDPERAVEMARFIADLRAVAALMSRAA